MSIITRDFELALRQLNDGNVVAIPTETVYGLAGSATNPMAIKKIYAMKQRPLHHPLIMHVHQDMNLLEWVSFIPNYAQALIEAFWPGPLTLVLPAKSEQVNSLITGGQATVALRCPQHPVAERLLNQLKKPLVAPSANPFGKISPTTASHVQDSFPNEDLLILEGGRCSLGIESTIILATHPDYYQILRQGSLHQPSLEKIASQCITLTNQSIRVPGQPAQHYQPTKPLYYFSTELSLAQFYNQHPHLTSYCMRFRAQVPVNSSSARHLHYQFPDSPNEAAYELYYQLRKADESTAECILIEIPLFGLEWRSLEERIIKAGRPLAS